jgi:hypothetical protein
MGLLARIEKGAGALGGAMVMDAEKFFDVLEPDIAGVLAPYAAKMRAAFADEMGYLEKSALANVSGMIKKALADNAAKFGGNPIGLIGAVVSAVLAEMPGQLSVLEQLAVHGFASAAVAALIA